MNQTGPNSAGHGPQFGHAPRSGAAPQSGFTTFTEAATAQSIPQAFARQVAQRPASVAVRTEDCAIDYATLDRLSDRAAAQLRALTGGAAVPVAMLCEQGLLSIVWTLGVLKAGAFYVALDQRLAEPALAAMLAHLQSGVLVASPAQWSLAERLRDAGRTLLRATVADAAPAPASPAPTPPIGADALAYVFYTSGSTGAPKGVMDSHRNVLDNVRRYTNTLELAPSDTLSLVQNPSFSGTVSSLFGALANGASVAPFDLQARGTGALSEWIDATGVTVFHSVPSIFRQLAGSATRFARVRIVRLEGDRANRLDLLHFHAQFSAGTVLVNGLGATECGLVRQYFHTHGDPLPADDPVPIGAPVPGVVMQIVDEHSATVPTGVVGECVVASRHLALGYWRDAARTAERFPVDVHGTRRYRTGDLGRCDANGCVTHLGRIDQRIRISGEFVDVQAIERACLSLDAVAQCVVADFADRTGERRLAAYIVLRNTDDTAGWAPDDWRRLLEPVLGERQLPAVFVRLDALPMTPDRKVDRTRLPAPDRVRPALSTPCVAPRSSLERTLAAIWCDVLELDHIGVIDSFFDLGGDSLRAHRVVAQIAERLDVRLPIAMLFDTPTISALATRITTLEPHTPPVGSDMRTAQPPAEPNRQGHAVAIIGMAGRFAGADDLTALWDLLCEGRTGITRFDDCATQSAVDLGTDTSTVGARGILPDADRFDATLFGLTPRQAQWLDPQQRIWLETAYSAMEDAGVAIGRHRSGVDAPVVGVFAGGRESTYLWHLLGGDAQAVAALLARDDDDAYNLWLGNDHDSLATRTADLLGLRGPAINVQSACSTSLVAVAQACDALIAGHCDVALAGGVAITFPQRRAYTYRAHGIESRDGVCRPFDAEASGTVFADGVGAVVLKRFDRAVADGDRIDAVIRGWAVNNDGGGKASFAAPSIDGQVRVIERALERADVSASAIGFVETHGTATPIGDPIEFAALARVFGRADAPAAQCALGATKANVGHADTAAGVAGLIKTVLALRHRRIPPLAGFRSVNPQIELAGSPFRIPKAPEPWPVIDGTRLAGVSSLGVGGTNCHLVVEQPPLESPGSQTAPHSVEPCVFTLSAVTEPALLASMQRFADALSHQPDSALPPLARAAQRTRSHLRHRVAVVGQSSREIADALRRGESGVIRGTALPAAALRIGWLFSGQGSTHAGMGRQRYQQDPVFRGIFDACDRQLQSRLERPLRDVLFAPDAEALIARSDYAQPALYALQVALAGSLRADGIEPAFVLGHSVGEFAAAAAAGVFDVAEGLDLVATRGRLMAKLRDAGAMIAVQAPAGQIAPLLEDSATLCISAFNAPEQIVVSGGDADLAALSARLGSMQISVTRLSVTHAFHSRLVEPILDALRDAASAVSMRAPRVPWFSTCTGRLIASADLSPGYWADHARQPVRFVEALVALHAAGGNLLIEIGPHDTLCRLATACEPRLRDGVVPVLRQGAGAPHDRLHTLAKLYVRGVDLPPVAAPGTRTPAGLPAYPFERARHWYAGKWARGGADAHASEGRHPLIGRRLWLPGSTEIRFSSRFSTRGPIFIDDHRLFGVALPPGASHLAMLAEVLTRIEASGEAPPGGLRFVDLSLPNPLLLRDGEPRAVQLVLRPGSREWQVELLSAASDALDHSDHDDAVMPQWTTHLVGHAQPGSEVGAADLDPLRFVDTAGEPVSGAEFYSRIWANQGGTGRSFRWIESAWSRDGEALCRAVCPASITDVSRYRLHPGLIEAACQVLHLGTLIESVESLQNDGVTWVPFSVERYDIGKRPSSTEGTGPWWCYARRRSQRADAVIADLCIMTDNGQVMARIDGFCLRPIRRDALQTTVRNPMRIVTPAETNRASHTDHSERTAGLPSAGTLPTLIGHCAALSGLAHSAIDPDRAFVDHGLDSLMAVTLANLLRRERGIAIGAVRILTCATLRELSEEIDALDPAALAGAAAAMDVTTAPDAARAAATRVVSSGQRRLWFMQQRHPDSTAYNVPIRWRGRGALDAAAFEQALHAVIDRHEVLRTTLRLHAGELACGEADRETALLECTASPLDDESASRAFFDRPFDLARDRLLRAQIVVHAPDRFTLNLCVHHIAYDGWSAAVLFTELGTAYSQARTGATANTGGDTTLQYSDFARWQRAFMTTDQAQRQIDYWRTRLAGLTMLPRIGPTPTPGSDDAAGPAQTISHRLDLPLVAAIDTLANGQRVTQFMLLMAAFQVLLHRHTGVEDIAVGTAVAGRPEAKFEGLVGFFLNAVALRCAVRGNATFIDLLAQVRQTALEAYEHQDVPFEKLVEVLQPERTAQRHPLFQVMLIHQRLPGAGLVLDGVQLEPEAVSLSHSALDLTLYTHPRADGLELRAEFDCTRLHGWYVKQMLHQLETLLRALPAHLHTEIAALPLIDDTVRRKLLVDWSGAQAAARWRRARVSGDSIFARFNRLALASPQHVAIIERDRRVSRGELLRLSEQISARLLAEGVRPGDRVALRLPRGALAICTMLSVLRCGGLFVPLDPEHPTERHQQMLDDAGVRVLLHEGAQTGLPAGLALTVIDAAPRAISDAGDSPPSDDPALAYVLFTSGTTGRPKGVTGTQDGVLNRIDWMQRFAPLTGAHVVAHKTSLGFVDSIWEIFGPLLTDARIAVIPLPDTRDPRAFTAALVALAVTHLVATPSWLDAWVESLSATPLGAAGLRLQMLVSSGEALTTPLLSRLRSALSQCRLLNVYGSTEVSADATFIDLAEHAAPEVPPIGRPIDGAEVYVLDAANQPVPIGVQGELCIGGVVVAAGYWNAPEANAERFIANPFGAATLFRSGDLGYFDDRGRLHLCGRRDGQLKIRGNRVEPQEIESVCLAVEGVNACVVDAPSTPVDAAGLVLYVSGSTGYLTADLIRQRLRRRLPEYMMPTRIVLVDGLPRTPSGKVDRAALRRSRPARAANSDLPDASGASLDSPDGSNRPERRDERLRALMRIWQTTLGHDDFGIDHDFFDIGGHSLLGVRLIGAVEAAFGVTLPVAALFEARTVRSMARRLDTHRGEIDIARPVSNNALPAPGNAPDAAARVAAHAGDASNRSTGAQTASAPLLLVRAASPASGDASWPAAVPIFLFAPNGHTVLYFQRMMADFDARHPVYGIDNVRAESVDSVNGFTAPIAEALLDLVPIDSRCCLIGACLGAHYAYDVATRLAARNRAPMLVVIDASSPANGPTWQAEPAPAHQPYYAPSVMLRALRQGGWRFAMHRAHVRWQARSDADVRRYLRVMAHQTALLDHFHATPAAVRLLHIESESWHRQSASARHWQSLALGGYDNVVVPGTTHYELNRADTPYASRIAAIINAAL